MSAKSYLGGKVVVHGGDCLDVLKELSENSVDSCVTDPPYALVSIAKRFGANGAAPPKDYGGSGVYQRASAGFMGQQWDTGDRAFSVEFWREVFRVLKPGGHMLAFGGTRTVHRLACAIEDAGFEIRDQIMWVFGSGFPKSHDVSKGIDKLDANDKRRERNLRFTAWMRSTNLTRGNATSILRASGAITENGTMAGHFFAASDEGQPAVATRELFDVMRPHFGAPVPKWVEALVDERTVESENFKRREVVGSKLAGIANPNDIGRHTIGGSKAVEVDITAPATSAAREWQGWGTALKPAVEPIVLARKPLSEKTVACNVLRHGTGALNVDGCRVATDELTPRNNNNTATLLEKGFEGKPPTVNPSPLGRWPANLIHDGSDEVVAAFPETQTNAGTARSQHKAGMWGIETQPNRMLSSGDTGSAARFFASFPQEPARRFWYSAKADKDDRLGSSHPTIKPVDLIQYLVRLITPPNGICLDPFAGTGTTGEAAFREGMRAILIEREPEYLADIERRMQLVLSGPFERSQSSIKARGKTEHAGPLFALPEAAE